MFKLGGGQSTMLADADIDKSNPAEKNDQLDLSRPGGQGSLMKRRRQP
ncbi:hypothetical protein [Caulobacter segnis]|nr:hypothetical protein [Caulobacter segnis]